MICTLEMPNADAEALLRLLRVVDTSQSCGGDPYEQSRLESALEAVAEAIEAGINDA
jgi:hypothetical protein